MTHTAALQYENDSLEPGSPLTKTKEEGGGGEPAWSEEMKMSIH